MYDQIINVVNQSQHERETVMKKHKDLQYYDHHQWELLAQRRKAKQLEIMAEREAGLMKPLQVTLSNMNDGRRKRLAKLALIVGALVGSHSRAH